MSEFLIDLEDIFIKREEIVKYVVRSVLAFPYFQLIMIKLVHVRIDRKIVKFILLNLIWIIVVNKVSFYLNLGFKNTIWLCAA